MRSMIITVALVMLFCSCGSEPPFEVESATSRLEAAQGGFRDIVIEPKRVDEVLVHRTSCTAAGEGGTAIPVDVYYPPRFSFRGNAPAVVASVGNPDWRYSISLGRALAASGLIAVVPNTRHYPDEFSSIIAELGTRADELFIDADRLAVWAEGHGSPCALETVMDAEAPFHTCLQGAVFLSPVLFMGNRQELTHDPAELCSDVPVLVAVAADDEFYEVRATVRSFREAAEVAGIPLEYAEVPEGGHNWMSDADTTASRATIEEAIRFVRKQL